MALVATNSKDIDFGRFTPSTPGAAQIRRPTVPENSGSYQRQDYQDRGRGGNLVQVDEGKDIDFQLAHDSSGLFGKELPGVWQSRAQIRRAYRWIFVGYRVFGNDSFMRTNRFARKIWRLLQRLFKRPIPGWFDTHARHSSISD